MSSTDPKTAIQKSFSEQQREQLWRSYMAVEKRLERVDRMQIQYRLLSSTWMLAAFGAVGYLCSTETALNYPRELFAAVVAAAGYVGVCLLWTVDLLFYQKLASAAFVEARAMEAAEPWLPQLHSNLRSLMQGVGINAIKVFYVGSSCALLLTSGTFASEWIAAAGDQLHASRWGVIAVSAAVLGSIEWLLWSKTSTGDQVDRVQAIDDNGKSRVDENGQFLELYRYRKQQYHRYDQLIACRSGDSDISPDLEDHGKEAHTR